MWWPEKDAIDAETRQLMELALVLTAAAGGEIVVTKRLVAGLGKGRLVITEDVATGDKIYKIVSRK